MAYSDAFTVGSKFSSPKKKKKTYTLNQFHEMICTEEKPIKDELEKDLTVEMLSAYANKHEVDDEEEFEPYSKKLDECVKKCEKELDKIDWEEQEIKEREEAIKEWELEQKLKQELEQELEKLKELEKEEEENYYALSDYDYDYDNVNQQNPTARLFNITIILCGFHIPANTDTERDGN